MARKINSAGLALIESAEGFRSYAYKDQAGHLTIGYGHRVLPDEDFSGGIDEATAQDLLQQDLAIAEGRVSSCIKVPLNDNQFAALVSMTYNMGIEPLTMGLGQALNRGDYAGAAPHILLYNKVFTNGVFVAEPGLTARRQAEYNLFITPVEG